jgi:hypothetical protein
VYYCELVSLTFFAEEKIAEVGLSKQGEFRSRYAGALSSWAIPSKMENDLCLELLSSMDVGAVGDVVSVETAERRCGSRASAAPDRARDVSAVTHDWRYHGQRVGDRLE